MSPRGLHEKTEKYDMCVHNRMQGCVELALQYGRSRVKDAAQVMGNAN
jgi:hypothetical protein